MMKHSFLMMVIICTANVCFGTSGEVCRQMFHESELNENLLNEIVSQKIESDDALAIAYQGLCTSMMAEYVFFPTSKWQYFKDGKTNIELAVKKDSLNPEIRYVRLLLQLNLPNFLGYSDNINEDFEYFVNNIKGLKINELTKCLFVENLLESKGINQDQRSALIDYQCIS